MTFEHVLPGPRIDLDTPDDAKEVLGSTATFENMVLTTVQQRLTARSWRRQRFRRNFEGDAAGNHAALEVRSQGDYGTCPPLSHRLVNTTITQCFFFVGLFAAAYACATRG